MENLDIGRLIDGIRRRWWLILLLLIPGVILALAVAYVLPPRYESTARILVYSQQIPNQLAQTTVTATAQERLKQIEQLILARENMLEIIDRLNLFNNYPDWSPTDKVDAVRAATSIQPFTFVNTRGLRTAPPLNGFTITYSSESPLVAARVANEMVTKALELNLQVRSEQAQETRDFFRKEVERLASELLGLETELARFKNANEAALPQSLQVRSAQLLSLQQRMFSIDQQKVSLQENQRALREQLFTLQQLPTPPQSQTPEEQNLAATKLALVQAQSVYTPIHPEIKRLKAEVAALEAAVAASGTTISPGAAKSLQLQGIQNQISAIDTQLSLLDGERKQLSERVTALEASIAQTPQVEVALNALMRRYSDLNQRYNAAFNNLTQAETGEKLEIDQKAERFEVIEQARVPEEPVAPKRMLIAAGGSVGILLLGIGLAALLELLSSTIRTSADLERMLQLRPVVTVPYIYTRSELRRRRLHQVLAVLLIAAIIPSVVWLVDQYYLPIELLADRIMDKTGIADFWQSVKNRFG